MERDLTDDVWAELLARCTFPALGTPVCCGVSGGADSLALMALAVAAGNEVTAVHVDHGARPGSELDADVVRAAAARLGAAFRGERVTVPPGTNFEARARAARYSLLPDDVMTGHTADDQAETMLLNLMRGSGLEGLAGMRPGPRHPILSLRRIETRALCLTLGLEPVDDPSNDDPRFRRNRVRHELLPLLDDIAARDVVPLLVRLAGHTREAADHLAEQARRLDPIDAAALTAAPLPLARMALRQWLRPCSDQGHPPDAATIDRVLAVAGNQCVATDVGGGWRVARTAGRLRLEAPDGPDGAGSVDAPWDDPPAAH